MTLRRFPPIDLRLGNAAARALTVLLSSVQSGPLWMGLTVEDRIEIGNMIRILEIKLATARIRG